MTLFVGESSQPGEGSLGGIACCGTAKRAPFAERILPSDITKNLVETFKLLADETRLQILFALQQKRELNVRAICLLLKQSQPAVSHHLALLRVAGLIEMRRDGKHNFYRVVPDRFEDVANMVLAATPRGGKQKTLNDIVISYSQAE